MGRRRNQQLGLQTMMQQFSFERDRLMESKRVEQNGPCPSKETRAPSKPTNRTKTIDGSSPRNKELANRYDEMKKRKPKNWETHLHVADVSSQFGEGHAVDGGRTEEEEEGDLRRDHGGRNPHGHRRVRRPSPRRRNWRRPDTVSSSSTIRRGEEESLRTSTKTFHRVRNPILLFPSRV